MSGSLHVVEQQSPKSNRHGTLFAAGSQTPFPRSSWTGTGHRCSCGASDFERTHSTVSKALRLKRPSIAPHKSSSPALQFSCPCCAPHEKCRVSSLYSCLAQRWPDSRAEQWPCYYCCCCCLTPAFVTGGAVWCDVFSLEGELQLALQQRGCRAQAAMYWS